MDNMPQADSTGYFSKVWIPDLQGGMYKNPILYADYSDPDMIRVGSDFYMTASSFSCFPGLPILHSKDLVHWTLIGHALRRYPSDLFDAPQHGKGVWAPSIRFHNQMFHIYWGDPDTGIYRVSAARPQGPWEQPVLVLPGKGLIDPCPLWDEDGNAWLIHGWAKSRAGFNSILTIHKMNPDGSKVDLNGRDVFDGNKHHPTIEGPKLYKRNGYYYIFAPAGGVAQGWQTVLRSKEIYGPYEDRIVLAQGSTPVNGPHQGGWVDTPDGRSWFIHFQDLEAYGRVVHLQPLAWIDDWPLIGEDKDGSGTGQPVLTHSKPVIKGNAPMVTPQESDEFDTTALDLQWQWQANPRPHWYQLCKETQCLRLFAAPLPPEQADLRGAGNLLLQKFPAPDFQAVTKIRFVPEKSSPRAGLVIIGDDYACIELVAKDRKIQLRQTICQQKKKQGKEQFFDESPIDTDTLFLRVEVSSPDALCRFSYSLDGKNFTQIGKEFQAKPGRWIGAKVGLFCLSPADAPGGGHADFDWFRIEPIAVSGN